MQPFALCPPAPRLLRPVLRHRHQRHDDGGAAVDRRATASKISEGLKIAAIPCAANGVATSPIHHTAPTAGDLPLPPLSDDNDNDNEAENARTVGSLYLQSLLRRIVTRRPPPPPHWGAACHAL